MKKFYQSIVFKRVLGTILILFIYVLGTNLPLPFINTDSQDLLGGNLMSLAFSTALAGGSLRSLSVFSVGLSPYMSAMLLWQMFNASKIFGIHKLPSSMQANGQTFLMLAIALLQALATTINLPVQEGYSSGLVLTMNTFLLIAGSFFLVWLSDINAVIGVGGPMVIIMTSMIISIPQNIINSILTLRISWQVVALMAGLALCGLYLSVTVMRAKYRIPVNKIGLNNRFKRYSYFDIPLTPAGGMAFMYAMTLTTLPQYLFLLIQMLFPTNGWTGSIIQELSMGRPVWLFVYLTTLFSLSLAFAFVNVSGEQIAEKMKKSGEYIYGIYPGVDTSRYINHLVIRFAIIGSVYTIIMAGLPMFVIFYDSRYLQLSMIPGMLMMFTGMVYNIREEIIALRLNEGYKSLF